MWDIPLSNLMVMYTQYIYSDNPLKSMTLSEMQHVKDIREVEKITKKKLI